LKFLQGYIRAVDFLNEKIGQAVTWLSTILVLVVCYDVFTRYLLKESSVAVQELEWHLFALLFLIAAAYTLKHDRHVRVDVFYAKFPERLKAWIDFLGSLVFLIPFAVVSILASQKFVINSFLIGEKSPDPGGLPARYILKAAIPIGFFLLLLQAFSLVFKSLLVLQGKNSPAKEERS
jgi:TRAP-type mannitol/chloroaromatic compound transport system permease small subunit